LLDLETMNIERKIIIKADRQKEMFQAITHRDYKLLKRFGSFKFTAYDNDGLTLVKKLQSKQKEINDSEDNKLKELIRKIIKFFVKRLVQDFFKKSIINFIKHLLKKNTTLLKFPQFDKCITF